jgi:PAS domain S-box-containing protein
VSELVLFTLVYAMAGRAGLLFPTVHPSVSIVWPATGISIALFLLKGNIAALPVFAGAFLVNVPTAGSIATTFGIAAGNTCEGLSAAYLVNRLARGSECFERPRDIFAFAVLAGMAATALSATAGVLSLIGGGHMPSGDFAKAWAAWWLGDMGGALIVAPSIVLWARNARLNLSVVRFLELTLLGGLVSALGVFLFTRLIGENARDFSFLYLSMPMVVWAAFRFGRRAAAGFALVLTALAIGGTLSDVGPFAALTPAETILFLLLYVALLNVVGIAIAAAVRRQRRAELRVDAQYLIVAELSEGHSLEQAAPSILRAIGRSDGWDFGALWKVDSSTKWLNCICCWAPDEYQLEPFARRSRELRFRCGEGLAGRVWDEKSPSWIQNLHDDTNFPRGPVARDVGLRSGFAFPVLSKDGSCIGVIEFFSRRSRTSDAELMRMFAAVGAQIGDFVARRSAEMQLRTADATKGAILESALDCIITMNSHRRIVDFNPAAERTFGYTREQAVGRTVEDLIIPERFRAAHRAGLERFLTSGVGRVLNRRIEIPALHADGRELAVELAIAATPTGGSDFLFTAYLRDISARKHAEEERERLLLSERNARAEAEHAAGMKDEFLATLSHELRTPLNAILGYAQLVRRKGIVDLTDGLDVIERNARAQARLIDDLLDMNRIASGKLRLEIGRVDVAAVMRSALDTVRPAAAAKQIELRSSVEIEGEMAADAARLQQIIWNLLSNAVKFTPQGGIVELQARQNGPQVSITVRDSGIGIAQSFLPRLFERFSQANTSSDRNFGGLGLGLAIVKHLVELHGGTVSAQSEGAGRGSLFTVTLPLISSVERGAAVDVASRGEVKSLSAADVPSLHDVRVLALDDEPDSRTLIKDILQSANAHVVTAESSEEALSLMESQSFDVIVSDIAMPDIDGNAFMRRVRLGSRIRQRGIPAIALSAFAQAADSARAITSGFQIYLRKPIEPAELIAAVHRFARKEIPGEAHQPAAANSAFARR